MTDMPWRRPEAKNQYAARSVLESEGRGSLDPRLKTPNYRYQTKDGGAEKGKQRILQEQEQLPKPVRMSAELIVNANAKDEKSHKPNKTARGDYRLIEAMEKQRPLDIRQEEWQARYGSNPLFHGTARQLTPAVYARLNHDHEHLIVVQDHQARIGPRYEVMDVEGKKVQGRHTHLGFAKDRNEPVQFAGSTHYGKVNERTGHYRIHEDPDKRAKAYVFRELLDHVTFARDKTLKDGPARDREHPVGDFAPIERRKLSTQSSHGSLAREGIGPTAKTSATSDRHKSAHTLTGRQPWNSSTKPRGR